MTRGIHFDGLTADQHEVIVEAEDDALVLVRDGQREAVPAAEVKVIDEDSATLTLSRSGRPGWRLVLQKPVEDGLGAILPRADRYGGWIDRVGLGRATAALAGIAAVVLFVGYSAPAWLAPLIPASFDEKKVEKFGSDTEFTRAAQPAEMAPAYVFLATTESMFMTGEVLALTGGKTPF